MVSVLLAAGLTTSAFARRGAVQATDPGAGSPAGVVYSIPLDSARQDASPHGHGGSRSVVPVIPGGSGGSGGSGAGSGGTGGSGSGGSGSGLIGGSTGSSSTSSSGGSSSTAKLASNKKTPVLVPGGQPGSLVHSSNGFGSSSQVPTANTGLGAVQSNASSAPLLAFLLAAVVLLLGGYVGVRAWRSSTARKAAARDADGS